MVCLEPRAGKTCLHPDDVIAFLEREGESVAVVMLPGVQYYTGQLLDMRNITEVARRKVSASVKVSKARSVGVLGSVGQSRSGTPPTPFVCVCVCVCGVCV